jgi:hypothetical protein
VHPLEKLPVREGVTRRRRRVTVRAMARKTNPHRQPMGVAGSARVGLR